MYSFKNVLKQSPEEIKGGILLLLTLLTVMQAPGFRDISGETAAMMGLAIERFLTWFYVKPLVVNRDKLQQYGQEATAALEQFDAERADLTAAAAKPTRTTTKKAGS